MIYRMNRTMYNEYMFLDKKPFENEAEFIAYINMSFGLLGTVTRLQVR